MGWTDEYSEGRLTVRDGRTVAWTDWGDPASDTVQLRVPGMPGSRWAVRAVIGGSGAVPHELALCQRHPDRVRATTIVGGAAPVTDAEVETMIPWNRRTVDLVKPLSRPRWSSIWSRCGRPSSPTRSQPLPRLCSPLRPKTLRP